MTHTSTDRAAHPDGFPAAAEAGRPLKEVLVAHFSRLIWWDLAKNLGACEI